ncbi:MAG: TIGR04150 pseudo-rSAM protein [Bacteroidales bacterium]|nr:MAG: TIGR04150 pseudo-rSAM protein [Bacteroidales bacterium]
MNKYWFYIESYVYISIKNGKVLLFNTLNSEIAISDNPDVISLVTKLNKRRNTQVALITDEDLSNQAVFEFINETRNKFMSDYYETSLTKKKPFQFIPYIKIHREIKYLKKETESSIGENIKQYINKVVIFLNNECNHSCSYCNHAYKQYYTCTKSNTNEELNYTDLLKFLSQLKNLAVNITLTGGNIFKYKHLFDLIKYLKDNNFDTTIKVNYKNYLDFFDTINEYNINSYISIDSDISINALQRLVNHSEKPNINLQIPVGNEKEFDTISNLVNEYPQLELEYLPYYRGDNIDFFQKNIFVNQEDIRSTKPTYKSILINTKINKNLFGQLVITPSGNVFSNINAPKLGNLNQNVKELVLKEILSSNSWRKLRQNCIPCKNCNFRLLCPPISNLELSMKKNNLCHIL